MSGITGIHHVTAIAGDPQRNLDFYAGTLGLRFVKRTVNFDDPGTYHFYFGDGDARPGSLLTFFPWPGAPRGRHGAGQATAVAFSILKDAMGFWVDRLKARGVALDGPRTRFGEESAGFQDPDGLRLELVANDDTRVPWADGPVAPERAIRGIHSVTLTEEGFERTAALVERTLVFRRTRESAAHLRYELGAGGAGAVVNVESTPDLPRGRIAVGTVHHVAWRVAGDEEQEEWRKKIALAGLNVTPVIDRKYFHSIYFREPGGVLFEIATDGPGFAVDEPAADLGSRLVLPPWLEPQRTEIEVALPPLRVPMLARGA
jgi:glyoxalase family protein